MQHAQKKNMPLSPTLSGDAHFFSDECESAPQTAGDVDNPNKVSRTQDCFASLFI